MGARDEHGRRVWKGEHVRRLINRWGMSPWRVMIQMRCRMTKCLGRYKQARWTYSRRGQGVGLTEGRFKQGKETMDS